MSKNPKEPGHRWKRYFPTATDAKDRETGGNVTKEPITKSNYIWYTLISLFGLLMFGLLMFALILGQPMSLKVTFENGLPSLEIKIESHEQTE